MTNTNPLNILCAGECMVELRSIPPAAADNAEGQATQYATSFAGDVANFAVYLKRLQPNSRVQLLSATGDDALSEKMRQFLATEHINVDLVARSQDKTVGLYMIDTDDAGERSFSYWRSDSAAREMFRMTSSKVLANAVDAYDYFYFTGITLAILDQDSRERLFDLAEQFHRRGKTVVFDPNYRARLWNSKKQALTNIERAYNACNILLSSNEDEQTLWGATNTRDTLDRLKEYNIGEIILTNGANAVTGASKDGQVEIPPAKAEKVVDTTSAGDAFNAGYLAARHTGASIEESITNASSLASLVIAHPGAIVSKSSMESRCGEGWK